ncbi:MAG TPA: hypothetical protein VGM03_13970 [Phycisphaerae bacterium]
MSKFQRITVIVIAAAGFSLSAIGCKGGGKAQSSDDQRLEHPRGEHPKGEHPKGEHPKGEHPTGEHPK